MLEWYGKNEDVRVPLERGRCTSRALFGSWLKCSKTLRRNARPKWYLYILVGPRGHQEDTFGCRSRNEIDGCF